MLRPSARPDNVLFHKCCRFENSVKISIFLRPRARGHTPEEVLVLFLTENPCVYSHCNYPVLIALEMEHYTGRTRAIAKP